MGDYTVLVTVEDDEHNTVLRVAYEIHDAYEISEVLERDIEEAIEDHEKEHWGIDD